MVKKGWIKEFDWDEGNIDKSYKKHGVAPNKAEEIFLDENIKIVQDVRHSQRETRFIALGQTFDKKVLFVIFTLRGTKIRIISSRSANLKERSKYEEKT